ncbi:sensor histidine kinase [Agathobaculum sp.]|uniref:sensor histidine kinase n=1 Tax=Agathobaculum sp. TaxID=2048138 RepID=UPI002A81D755|nr:sensor histidine kinase [Agathobaculum sp.]MDY3619491.1 sensor histidine kinase [Agathobaculum sp.]
MKEKIKGMFLHSLGNRLFLYFTLLMAVPLTLVGFSVYAISVAHISDMALQSSTQIVEKVSGDMDSLLTDMVYISRLVDNDKFIEQATQQNAAFSSEQAVQTIEDRLRAINEFRTDIEAIYVRTDSGVRAKSRYYPLRNEPLLSDEDYERIKNRTYDEWFVSEHGSLVLDNRDGGVLAVAAALNDAATGRPNGAVLVEVRQDTLRSMLDVNIGREGSVLLLNAQNELMSAVVDGESEAVRSTLEVSGRTAIGTDLRVVDNKRDILLFQRMPGSNWVIAGVVPKSFLRQNGKLILMSILLIAGFALLCNIAVSGRLRDYELRPIREMIAYVRSVRDGRFGEPLEAVRDDEIGELSKNMQSMSERIGSLMEAVKEEQEQLRMAEFKAMQAQINPHFLYNTLDSIAWLSRDGKNQSVVEMVQALTTFFRTGLSRGRDIITVAEEARHVRSYLTIQKMRYAQQFDYMLYVDPAVESCAVPKLILQPLVENALYHGIKTCQHKCMLFVNVLGVEDGVLFEILDNGVGMPPDKLRALQNALERTGGKRAESFGMLNVYDRIRALTRGRFSFRIQSEEGIGTSITIRINRFLEE